MNLNNNLILSEMFSRNEPSLGDLRSYIKQDFLDYFKVLESEEFGGAYIDSTSTRPMYHGAVWTDGINAVYMRTNQETIEAIII